VAADCLPQAEPRQALGRREREIRPRLLAAVAGLDRHVLLRPLQFAPEPLVDGSDDRLMPRVLVPLQRQHVVPLAVDDLGGDRLLRPHRVDGDDRPLDVHQPQDFGDRRDLKVDPRRSRERSPLAVGEGLFPLVEQVAERERAIDPVQGVGRGL